MNVLFIKGLYPGQRSNTFYLPGHD